MKNYEKYAEEIKKFGVGVSTDFFEQKVLKPLGKSCADTDCCYCNLLKTLWLLEEYEEPKEPEIDWSKVEVDTPILVRNSEDSEWVKSHFARYDGTWVIAWYNGGTSWSANSTIAWNYAKLAETEGEK